MARIPAVVVNERAGNFAPVGPPQRRTGTGWRRRHDSRLRLPDTGRLPTPRRGNRDTCGVTTSFNAILPGFVKFDPASPNRNRQTIEIVRSRSTTRALTRSAARTTTRCSRSRESGTRIATARKRLAKAGGGEPAPAFAVKERKCPTSRTGSCPRWRQIRPDRRRRRETAAILTGLRARATVPTSVGARGPARGAPRVARPRGCTRRGCISPGSACSPLHRHASAPRA